MKILEITYQHRRDFIADFICEGCGKTCEDLGVKGEFTQTKHPEGSQV